MIGHGITTPAAIAALLLVLPIAGRAETVSWETDVAHSHVGFQVRHMMIANVKGEFGKYKVKVQADPKELAKATVEATIEVSSINTGNAKRDEHLRSPDFFHVAKYPTMTFKSKSVKQTGKGQLKVAGDLTLRGVTRPVTLEVTGLVGPIKDPWGNKKVGFQATTQINRKDFGLTWNKALEAGGVVVGHEVKITIEAELDQQKK
jgi:polyisoprenoid-binding protein YceI